MSRVLLALLLVSMSIGLMLTTSQANRSQPHSFLTGLRSSNKHLAMVDEGSQAKWTNLMTTPEGPTSNTAINGALALTVPSLMTVRSGSSITFNVNASEPTYINNTISLSASGLPSGASLPAAHGNPVVSTFSWALATAQAYGNYTISFTATDNANPLVAVTQSVIVEVSKAVLPPAMNVPGRQDITVGTVLSVAVVATDLNLPPLPIVLSASGVPPGATFNPDTGVFTWVPSESQSPGHYVVIFTASNGLGGVTSDRVSISVSATTLGTASLSSIPDLTLTWIIPIFIGLLFGLVPWVLFLYKRRGEPTPTIGKGLHAAQEQDGIDYSQGEIPTDHSH